jgi:hypothetical protein
MTTDQTSESSTGPAQADPSAGAPERLRTKLARRWVIRMVLITAALLGFGTWALVDLVHFYPERGRGYAAYKQLEYLRAATDARTIFNASVPDPRARLVDLRERESTNRLTEMERRQLDWLSSLAVPGMGMLSEEHTVMADPQATRDQLEQRFLTENPPKGLSAFDLPSQWLIMFISWGFAAHLIILWLRVTSKTYRWDPQDKRLHLPRGASLVPADLEDVDKSKWHKFIVKLEVNDAHPKLGGQSVTLDLFRYTLLEEWVLEMEQEAFPDRQEQDEESAGTDEQLVPDAASGDSSSSVSEDSSRGS